MKCSDCGYNCHEKCAPLVPWQCSKIKGLKLEGPSPMDNAITDSKTDGRWLENTLHKRGTGNLFKAWKPRWFVLDFDRMQVC